MTNQGQLIEQIRENLRGLKGVGSVDSSAAAAMRRRNQPAVHPFALVRLALVAVVVLGIAHWGFGVGSDLFAFAVAALAVFGIPVVVVFGIARLVMVIRWLFRRWR
jgi:hypothetical protein